jgi:A/G-specific adenine glycosylase
MTSVPVTPGSEISQGDIERMAEVVEAEGHIVDAVVFRKALIAWGRNHFRPFPWRLTDDPYCILVAEVMLHRTQAFQVIPVYEQFIGRYPDIPSLAQATKDELHSILYSLGLYWRIDLIYVMAAELMERFSGQMPKSKKDLLSLSGVGDYIAGAVRCFAWNLPEPLLDTNTVRVVGRLFGLKIKDSSRRNRRFRKLIAALIDPHQPRAYNYALLDLADHVCMKKKLPECQMCPMISHCIYGASRFNCTCTEQGS